MATDIMQKNVAKYVEYGYCQLTQAMIVAAWVNVIPPLPNLSSCNDTST